jgi:ribosomal protein S27AE
MNSEQPGRYIKRRLGDRLKRQILEREGIVIPEEKDRAVMRICPRCSLANAPENRTCSRCVYPLSQEALDEIKAREKEDMKKALVELLEHSELMLKKFARMHGFDYKEISTTMQQSRMSSGAALR